MKKSELIFSAALVPLDWVLLIAAALSAYALRFNPYIVEIRPIIFELSFGEFFQIAVLIATVEVIIFAFAGLYVLENFRGLLQEIIRVIFAVTTGFFVLVLYFFWQRDFFDSRFIILAAFGLTILYVSVGRVFVRIVQTYLYTIGIGLHNLVVVGSSSSGDSIISTFHKNKSFGYSIIDRIREPGKDVVNELKSIEKEKHIDDIFFIDNHQLSPERVSEIVQWCSLTHVTLHYSSEYSHWPAAGVHITTVNGIPLMEFKKTTLDGWGRIIKRVFDIVLATILLIVATPLFIVVALLIKIDSKGSILFSRKDEGTALTRIGQFGKPFRYFKFRTMIPLSDSLRYSKEFADRNVREGTPVVKIKDDPRITRLGVFLRRWSIDELPELLLVIRGSMSLIGPRPHLPEEVARYQDKHRIVLTVKPGMTGLAQISGRSDLHFDEEVQLDAYYIQNWSLKLDIQILFKTIPTIFRRPTVL